MKATNKRANATATGPVTLDAATGEQLPTPSQRPRHIRLKTFDDVRREMEKVYRDMRTGKIDPADGTKLAFVLANIGKLIETDVKAGITGPDGKPLAAPTLGDFYKTVGVARVKNMSEQ